MELTCTRLLTAIFPPSCITCTGSRIETIVTPSILSIAAAQSCRCCASMNERFMSRIIKSGPWVTMLISPMFASISPSIVAIRPKKPGLSVTLTLNVRSIFCSGFVGIVIMRSVLRDGTPVYRTTTGAEVLSSPTFAFLLQSR